MEALCVNDNCYNLTKQLSKKLEFLSHVDGYINDARKIGDEKAEKTWDAIKKDEVKHSEMLRDLLVQELNR